MIDFAKIKVIAGDGGNGAGSFFHTKGKRLGKADGGDAGRGGNIYLVASRDLNTLEPFRFVKEYRAKRGERGNSNNRKGADGEDLEIKVPVGTVVKVGSANQLSVPGSQLSDESLPVNQSFGLKTDEPTTEKLNSENRSLRTDNRNHMFYDLIEAGQKVLLARGGEGGRGNAHLKDEYGRKPKAGEKGEEGEGVGLTLELKLIADVGLIGLPNAGKSTLLAQITSAHPAIADYPFTTLEPNLGVLEVDFLRVLPSKEPLLPQSVSESTEISSSMVSPSTSPAKKLVIADIPGLIEGASEGRGLGHLFLKHIERTRVLVHLVDISAGVDPIEAYRTVREELKKHSRELVKKREIIAFSKIDLVSKEELEKIIMQFKKMRKTVVAISAKKRKGLDLLISQIGKTLAKA